MFARILLPLLLACSVVAAAQAPLKPLERIGIRPGDNGAEFVLADSKTPFFVKGFNYVRLRGDHATFDADTESTKAHYDPERAEAMFGALSKAGYNTVRVFIIGRSKANPGIAGNFETTKALHELYMENILDFLDVHFYRTNKKESVDDAFRLNLASTGFFTPEMAELRKQQPVILGEFGAFDHVEKTFAEAIDSMVRVRDLALEAGVNGMLFWTYDSFEQPRLYHAASDWTLFVRKMGRFERDAGPEP